MITSSDKQTNGIKDLGTEDGELTMLIWQLPLLSVVFSNPHQTVVTNKERQNDNDNNSSNSNNNPHQNVVTNNKERQRRAVFDMIPTLKQDKRCRKKTTAAKAAASASASGNNKEMKKLLRKIFLEKTVAKKGKKYALRAHEKIAKENQKKSKSKMSVKDLIMRGVPSVVQILLRIG